MSSWALADKATDNNNIATATAIVPTSALEPKVYASGVSFSGDNVDFYTFTVTSAGNYSLDLSNINGKNIKASIGTEAKGAFKSLVAATGAAGSDTLHIVKALAAGTYYVKVESTTKATASEYSLELTRNEDLAGFNTNDNTWKQAAANIYDVAEVGDVITDWVGFGDAVDVFKVRTDSNGQLFFDGNDDATANALVSRAITLGLADSAGKAVKLTYDKEAGSYLSNNILMADADYYLEVKSANPNKQNTAYQIAVGLR